MTKHSQALEKRGENSIEKASSHQIPLRPQIPLYPSTFRLSSSTFGGCFIGCHASISSQGLRLGL